MYAIMYIVEFSKGLSLWSCTVQVMKIVAICTTGLTSAYLCVNTVSMTYNCIIIELEGKKNLWRQRSHWNNRILWVTNFLQTGQWSTRWAHSQQSWCPHRKAVFLGSVKQIEQAGVSPSCTVGAVSCWAILGKYQSQEILYEIIQVDQNSRSPSLYSIGLRHSKHTFSLLAHPAEKSTYHNSVLDYNTA